ncbi:sortase B protein-sorting domain-containing protein [Helcococcus kunzii]|uniref:sortase B protein-sorting domain-containing protein n=1 Tax=Helcococcus kunzii TaxID=40091 RepID=UPI001BB0754D|nr:sortase B protein-sorting domain-containing protein [Helcococcus kunzii]QUY65545.1 sortase B protein-sorting domain-containing protein [Helcococcus kunzii]
MHHSPFKIEYHSRFPLNGHLAHGDYFDPNFEEIFNEGLLSMLNNEDATDKITSDKKQVLVGLLPSKLAEIRFNITIKDKYLEVNFFNVNIETFKIKETKAPSGYIAGESKEVTLEGFTLFDYKEYDEVTNEAAKQREIKIRKDLEDFTRKNHVRLVEFKNKEDFEKDYHSVGDRIKAKFHSPIKLDIINKLDPKEENQVLPEKPNHEDGIKPEEPGKEENAKPQLPGKEDEAKPEAPKQDEEAQPEVPNKEDEEAQPEVPNKDEEAQPEAPKQDDQKDMEKPKKDDQKGMEKPKQNDHKDMVVPKQNDQNISNKQKENKPEAQKNMQMKESGKSKKDMPNKNLNAKANKDKSMKNPKTGDNNDIVLYSSIVAIAGLSLLAVGFLKKKNNKEEII